MYDYDEYDTTRSNEVTSVELDYTLEYTVNAYLKKHPKQVFPLIQNLLYKCISDYPDIAPVWLTERITDLVKASVRQKNKQLNKKRLSYELGVMGLEFLDYKGTNKDKIKTRMFQTVTVATGLVGDDAFDERLYCGKDSKSSLKIAKLVREVYEYLKDGGSVDDIVHSSMFPERREFLKKMVEYYDKREAEE